MGLDGGTKITRSDVLRGQSWRMSQSDTSRSTRGGSVNQVFQERQLDAQTRRAVLWSCCALSGLPLCPPLVCDALGQLMNRQAVLEHLLAARSVIDDEAAQLRYANQQRAGDAFDHIKSLKDVFTVILTVNPELQPQQQQQQQTSAVAAGPGSSAAPDVSLWVCPVTLTPCGGKQPFSALRPCGHVLSVKALSALAETDKTSKNSRPESEQSCPVCGVAFDSSKDVVPVNGNSEHMESVRSQLRAKAAAKAAKKGATGDASTQKKRSRELLEGVSRQEGTIAMADGQKAPKLLEVGPAAAAAAAEAVPKAASGQQLLQQQLKQASC